MSGGHTVQKEEEEEEKKHNEVDYDSSYINENSNRSCKYNRKQYHQVCCICIKFSVNVKLQMTNSFKCASPITEFSCGKHNLT